MATGATPLQPLPPWMSWVSNTVALPTGGYSISFSIVNLPLTYYGPSIPLPTDGTWTYGGLSSPPPTTSRTSTQQPSTISNSATSTYAIPTTTTFTTSPPSSSLSSSTTMTSSSQFSTTTSLSSPTLTPTTSSSYSTTSSTTSSAPPTHHLGLSTGARAGIIAGSVVGGIVLLGLLLCFCLWLNRRRRRQYRSPLPGEGRGDSSFGNLDDEDGEWQIVHPRSGGPSATSQPSGEGHADTSPQGSGNSRRDIAGHSRNEIDGETSDPDDIPSATSSLFVALPVAHDTAGHTEGIWTPWRGEPERNYRNVPTSDASQGPENVGGVRSPPMRPRSAEFSDGHNSEAEQETLLDPTAVSAAAVLAGSTTAGSTAGSSSQGRIVERAREAVAQRQARQRASYVPGAASFFQFFRNSWTSGRNGPRTPGPSASTEGFGFRARSEKSQKSVRSKLSSTHGGSQGAPVGSQRTHHSSSEKSEKSVFVPQHDGTDDSPPTPHSSQFPSPPPTHLEAHAMIRQRSQTSTIDRQFRTLSGYSTGGGSMGSGNTVYFDAEDAPPLPSPMSPYLQQHPSDTSVRLVPPRLQLSHPSSPVSAPPSAYAQVDDRSSGSSELVPPPRLREIQPTSPISSIRAPGSVRSQQSSLRSLAYRAGDFLDEPPPLPSASLDLLSARDTGVPSSPPPSYTDWRNLPPPGLEQYNQWQRPPVFDRSDSHVTSDATAQVDVLEEEPPTPGSQWRRIAAGDDPLPLEGGSAPPVRLAAYLRQPTLGTAFTDAHVARSHIASFHSGGLLPRSAATSISAGGRSSREPSSAEGAPTASHRMSPQSSHSQWSRSDPVAGGVARMPSLSVFGERSTPPPPPLDEYEHDGHRTSPPDSPAPGGIRLVRPNSRSQSRSSFTSFSYAI